MAKINVTFMSYDSDVYGSVEDAKADGALNTFDMEVMDMNHLYLCAETLKRGMKLQAAVTGGEEPLLIIQMRL